MAIPVKIQAIKDTELNTNTEYQNKGVLTFTDTKVLLGIGNANIDYLGILKTDIIKDIEVPIIYQGTKTTEEIETLKETSTNTLVFDSVKKKLCFIDKQKQINEIPIEGGGININYAERYIAGTNITIEDNLDGTKTINATPQPFTGFNIVSRLPNLESLAKDDANKIYIVY